MPQEFASGGVVDRGVPVSLVAAGTVQTASTAGSAFDTGPDGGSLEVEVTVTAATGTTPTLTVVVESSQDGTNWTTLGTIGANGYAAGTTATAPTNFTAAAGPIRAVFPRGQFVRARSVIGGTTPSFTYGVTAVAS